MGRFRIPYFFKGTRETARTLIALLIGIQATGGFAMIVIASGLADYSLWRLEALIGLGLHALAGLSQILILARLDHLWAKTNKDEIRNCRCIDIALLFSFFAFIGLIMFLVRSPLIH